ncbi:MAG: hypothetical protein M1277_00735 [Patescibacteria group bacterium]|nr:hypothetical protein [Patescibacteria group bacterium]
MNKIERFSNRVVVPGRICLAGENIDWISGPVLTAAIDTLNTSVYTSPATGRKVTVNYLDTGKKTAFELDKNYNYERDSTSYVKAVIATLVKSGYQVDGLDLQIESNLPQSGGLASSGSFCVAIVAAINSQFRFGLNELQIADIAYTAESEEMGIGCGQMDQYSVSLGGTLYLNCSSRPPEIQKLKTNNQVVIIIGDTRESSRFSDFGEQLRRRLDIEDEGLLKYVSETERAIQEARKLLSNGNWNPYDLGRIIDECQSYITLYKGIHNPIIDSYIKAARNAGAYCAKTSGTRNNGGCMFALSSIDNATSIARAIRDVGGISYVSPISNLGIRYNMK